MSSTNEENKCSLKWIVNNNLIDCPHNAVIRKSCSSMFFELCCWPRDCSHEAIPWLHYEIDMCQFHQALESDRNLRIKWDGSPKNVWDRNTVREEHTVGDDFMKHIILRYNRKERPLKLGKDYSSMSKEDFYEKCQELLLSVEYERLENEKNTFLKNAREQLGLIEYKKFDLEKLGQTFLDNLACENHSEFEKSLFDDPEIRKKFYIEN